MSFNVPNSFYVDFKENMELTLQQNSAILWPNIDAVDVAGEKTDITEFIGGSATQTGDDRHGDTKYNNTPHDRVWMVKPPEEYWAELVDRQDQIATKIALGSAYMMAAVAAINRAKDDAVLAALYGSIITGKAGTTTTALGTSMAVPVTTGGASGAQRMNVAKLIAAGELLDGQYVDGQEERWVAITTKQNSDLLAEVPATSSDFKGAYGGVFENGKIRQLLGWNFAHIELSNPLLKFSNSLSLDGSGYRKNPYWVKSGIKKGAWEELFTDISPMPTKRLSKQVFAATIVSATRTQAGKVGYIANSEA